MVNVSHDGNNRRALNHFIWIEVVFIFKETINIGIVHFHFFVGFNTVIHHQQFNGITVKRLVLSGHNAHHKEFFNNLSWFTFDTFCDFCNSHPFSIFKFLRQFVEFAFCDWFWCLVAIVFAFFVFITVPITIFLISHLILTIPVFSSFAWTVLIIMIIIS